MTTETQDKRAVIRVLKSQRSESLVNSLRNTESGRVSKQRLVNVTR